MGRADGRIEPGQSLKSAISARAWNRAQDAADIVLGQRYGFRQGSGQTVSPGALVVPCNVSTQISGIAPGYVVSISGPSAYTLPSWSDITKVASLSAISGEVVQPVVWANYHERKRSLGVIVGGTTMPVPGNAGSRVVDVCVAGPCIARVRNRGAGEYISGPVARSGDNSQSLIGAAESSSCGHQRIISYLASINDILSFALVML